MKTLSPYSTIADLAELFRSKALSPVDVIDGCVARIERLNPRLNAFITIFADQARKAARTAESEMKAGGWRGPLHGVPIGIKDFYDTAGSRTTAAFERFKDRVPAADAAAVAALKNAGAIIVGKTNMHQLGMGTTGLQSYFGPAHNPWNDAFIPGGSSSGSAAAVAGGLCCATIDTDAIGSCRLPAACCGDVGFKGTYGLISSKGILEGEKADEVILWLSHPGVTTRTVEDTALMLDVLAGTGGAPGPHDFHRRIFEKQRVRAGVADHFKADQELHTAFAAALQTLRTLGHEIAPANAPFDTPRFGDIHAIAADRKAAADRWFEHIDVVLLPTTTTTVPTVESARANPQALAADNTMFANYFGLPAISVPCGTDARGLPMGLQIVGKPGGDGTVLSLAHQYQKASAPGGNPPQLD